MAYLADVKPRTPKQSEYIFAAVRNRRSVLGVGCDAPDGFTIVAEENIVTGFHARKGVISSDFAHPESPWRAVCASDPRYT